MSYGFWGTLDEFIKLSVHGSFPDSISQNREVTGGVKISQEEIDVWAHDIKILNQIFSSLADKYGNSIFVGCEYDIPGHLGRCDLILVGIGYDRKLKVIVIELKSWIRVSPSDLKDYVLINDEYILNPIIQAQQYKNRLKIFHELSNRMEVSSLVLMTGAKQEQIKKIEISSLENNIYSAIDQIDIIKDKIVSIFTNDIKEDENDLAYNFIRGKCRPSITWAHELLRRLPSITSGISKVISNTKCLDLSPKQQELVASILHHTNQVGKTLILISGQPGSGKTIV